jgi:prepilin peptidase CpaA
MHIFQGKPQIVASVVLVVVLVVASWTDVTTRRIPNWLTISAIVAGLAVRASIGLAPFGGGALGLAVACLLALPFFATGVLGGGDAKLLMAVGTFMGPTDVLWASLMIAVVGGIVALIEAARRRMLVPTLASCGLLIVSWVTLGRRGGGRRLLMGGGERLAVPYGVAIAAGSLVWWFGGGLLS